MADKSDKQFDPTPQRLAKAREEGQVFKSQESMAIGMLTVGVTVLIFGLPYGFEALRNLMQYVFLNATSSLSVSALPVLITEVGQRAAVVMLPFMATLVVTAVGLNILMSGWNVTLKPLMPKPDKVSPLKGLKKLFSAQGAFGLVKALLKIGIVGPIAYLYIHDRMPEIMMLHTQSLTDILATVGGWIAVLVFQIIGVLLVLAAADYAFEKWRFKEDLKMSKQEIKDEAKNAEGDQQVKGKRRQRAMEIARSPRLDHAVMQADVVVTNPTHYAVALRYDADEGDAPRVIVKGIRKRALRIKELAREHEIPTVEDRPLARALYASVEEEHEIPEELYPAVAALLAEIYRQRDPGRYGA